MKDIIFRGKSFLDYKLNASGRHGIHSPFIFEFIEDILNDNSLYYAFGLIESVRSKLLFDKRVIQITDYGTGINRTESISEIAEHSSIKPKYGRLLFRIINKYNLKNIIELGTSIGLSTLYLSMAGEKNEVVTLEGCKEKAGIAIENFNRLKRKNIRLVTGEFSSTLPSVLGSVTSADMVYIDGNHKSESTIHYFNECLKASTENSIFIFDDIYWNRDMKAAWEEIKNHNAVTFTIDLYQMGLAFFRRGIIKQHFTLRF